MKDDRRRLQPHKPRPKRDRRGGESGTLCVWRLRDRKERECEREGETASIASMGRTVPFGRKGK